MFSNVRIVLVNTLHPGNIGAAARAMKNMGFKQLYLVNPKRFPDKEAIYRASNADDVVENAMVVSSLQEALLGAHVVFGTSARDRVMPQKLFDVRKASIKIVNDFENQEIAIVFGSERTGLTNEEYALCQYHIRIPTVDDYSSLNLAAAVQVVVYELRMQSLLRQEIVYKPDSKKNRGRLATFDELEGLYGHMEQSLLELGFLDPNNPRNMMPRLRRIFGRSELDCDDVDLLRGLMRAIVQSCF